MTAERLAVPYETGEHGQQRPRGAEHLPRKAGEVERIRYDGLRFVLRWAKCGKSTCRSCPHGPYWYLVIRRGQRDGLKYVGKDLVAWIEGRRRRRWLDEERQATLPGVPDVSSALPAERPVWMDPTDWARYQVLYRRDPGQTSSRTGCAGGCEDGLDESRVESCQLEIGPNGPVESGGVSDESGEMPG